MGSEGDAMIFLIPMAAPLLTAWLIYTGSKR